jgi:transcriptional regulator with XRE-family HTH domain
LSGLPTLEGTDVNAALRKALAAAQLTETDVAAHLGVDPKTVRRWLSGQQPYPRHRWALADLLRAEESTLWPPRSQPGEAYASASDHAQCVYAHRWQVPRVAWWNLFDSAEHEIGILVYSGLFLFDDPGMLDLLKSRAQGGVSVRIMIGEPTSQAVRKRGDEEGIGKVLSARASNALLLLRALGNVYGVTIRTHISVLYNSIYLTEKQVFVNHHLYGLPAARSPVTQIDRDVAPDTAETYAKSFARVWRQAVDREA